MEDYQLLIDLHKRSKRQGPGGDTETKRALQLAMLDDSTPLKIADIGCGTGGTTLFLAKMLNAQITAVDFLPEFIEVLETNAKQQKLTDKIDTLVCSMDNLQFENEEFDVIWSEGAIYNMGFKNGVENWKRFLKPNGLLAVSEITWITKNRPAEIQKYWETAYPEIDTASEKIKVLESTGYSPIGYFVLPEYCWLDNYYQPLKSSFSSFLERNNNSKDAQAIVEAENEEIALYEKFKKYYSYGFYIARKVE